jgi:hypothetical protein
MTDRELLEAAAKAAGKKVHTRNQADRDACGAGDVGLWISEGQTCWNPLTDDGDALRLAVKLNINLSFYPEPDVCEPWVEALSPETASDELLAADPLAATRRAIVRAAAEIGKEMK